MKNRIAFIANFQITFFFAEIAELLKKSGIEVYWIAINLEQYNFLKTKYSSSNILVIDKTCIQSKSEPIGDFKLNELIFGDRILKHQQHWALDYLVSIQQPIYNFIKDNKINFISGEVTWAHEILIHRITRAHSELKCQFLMPQTTRIPNNRIAFFSDEFCSKIIPRKSEVKNKEQFKIEKPSYLKRNDKLLKNRNNLLGSLKRLAKFITLRNYEKNDPTRLDSLSLWFWLRFIEFLKLHSYALVKRASFEEVKDKKYILYAVHKQPEATIDVWGRYYEDQAQNIINLWRIIPHDWCIVVKEHTNAIGDRSYFFYKKIRSFRNIIVVDEKVPSKQLVENSQFVSSVVGTIAFEASLMGKQNILFSDTFFDSLYTIKADLNRFKKTSSFEELNQYLEKSDIANFKKEIMQNSFEGSLGDPVNNPQAMEKDNIESVSLAYIEIINDYN